jgi:hypothetical protein
MGQSGPRLLDAHAKNELRAARAHILNYLEPFAGLSPTLETRDTFAIPKIVIYPSWVGSGRR